MNILSIKRSGIIASVLCLLAISTFSQTISNSAIIVRAIRDGDKFSGFDLFSASRLAARVRLSSGKIILADSCKLEQTKTGSSLVFSGLKSAQETGLKLNPQSFIKVSVEKDANQFPQVSFDLMIDEFDSSKWTSAVGKHPFHFLTLHLDEALVWHTRGWLNATPLADPFPLLLDRHVGSPEISAYHYNRNWSYTVPLGAHPIAVIGLWAPQINHYVAFEFESTRLTENSERDIATGYYWAEPETKPANPSKANQFVALVYPYGGSGYQSLVLPESKTRITSKCFLIYSLNMPSTADPNRFIFEYTQTRYPELLVYPKVPVDLSWLPGGIRLNDFERPPGGLLIAGVEGNFQVQGSRLISGWRWHNEFPLPVAVKNKDNRRIEQLQRHAEELLSYAKKFVAGGEQCVYWEKPLVGTWTPEWGGEPVKTLHNANGFAAGRLFLSLYRDLARTNYLEIVDGVFNWAKHIVWTRNEFADVPSSPFAIGGTLPTAFCLDYYFTFKNASDQYHRKRAEVALELARNFTYRYLIMWRGDNNRFDNLDATFLWEPNSGRDWTGAACANEVFWCLDTLAQTAVHTGDQILATALNGSLSRWNLLYQKVWKDSLREYAARDMTEGYGLYAGNVYGLGSRATYGFAAPVVMCEPVGNSILRILAGQKGAMVFNKSGRHTIIEYEKIGDADGDFAFKLISKSNKFDLSVTMPYVDLSEKKVYLERNGVVRELEPSKDFIRPQQSLWSLYINNLSHGDKIYVGSKSGKIVKLPVLGINREPIEKQFEPQLSAKLNEVFRPIKLQCDSAPSISWDDPSSYAGLPDGSQWSCGIRYIIQDSDGNYAVTKPLTFKTPIKNDGYIALFYGDGDGQPPDVVFADGTRISTSAGIEGLAWSSWPPIYQGRIVLSLIETSGRAIRAIMPNSRPVFALSVSSSGTDKTASQSLLKQIVESAKTAQNQYQQLKNENQTVNRLAELAKKSNPEKIAILPPSPGGPAINLSARAGLLKRMTRLTAEQLINTNIFNPKNFPIAIYADAEDYINTVRNEGDAASAVVNYVKNGGHLVFVATGPWPMFYATGRARKAEALTPKLGLPLRMSIETPPASTLMCKYFKNDVLNLYIPSEFSYPENDKRLRAINPSSISANAKYTRLVSVVDSDGKDYGDSAGVIQFPNGGRITYISSIHINDARFNTLIVEAVLKHILEQTTVK